MHELTANTALRRTIRGISIVALLCAAPAFAQQHPLPPRPANDESAVQSGKNQPPCATVEDCADQQFDDSGTEGREGLGADPEKPEGPGDVSD